MLRMRVGVRVTQCVRVRVAVWPVSRVQQFPYRAHVCDEWYVVLGVRVFPWVSVAASHVRSDAYSAAAVNLGEHGVCTVCDVGAVCWGGEVEEGFVADAGEGEDGMVWENRTEGVTEIGGEGG